MKISGRPHDIVPDLKQTAVREYALVERGTGPWTTLYQSWHKEHHNGAEFAAFCTGEYRDSALADSGWDLSIGEGAPGFNQTHDENGVQADYRRYGGFQDGVEPIVLLQDHHGVKEKMLPELSEEFRLFHNLWRDPSGKRLVKVNDDGTEEVAAEISHEMVRVRTKYLRKFQAARQLHLLLFIDSVAYFPDEDPEIDFEKMGEDVLGEDHRYFLSLGIFDKTLGLFSRFNGKRIVAPPELDKSGVWPFQSKEQDYPAFIIGENEAGDPVENTCNPEELANYFGANPDSPHYLTPVFFRRDVLQRYYEDTDKFSVQDGALWCGDLWMLRIDNDGPDHIMVFLGDLGRDLPEVERGYWKTFNIVPVGEMSETVFQRSFMAVATNPKSPDLRIKKLYRKYCENWRALKGWDFFHPLHAADQHVFMRLRVPLSESQPEFEDQVLGLTKILVDSLNEKAFTNELGGSLENEKGISKLERWLESQSYPSLERDIAFLRRLQRLRSKMAAHRKGSKYEKLLEEEGVNESLSQEIAIQFEAAIEFLEGLSAHFGVSL